MKTTHKFAPLLSLGVATLSIWALGAAVVDARQPRAASSTVTRTGPAGNSATRKSSIATDGQGGYTRSGTTTGPNGSQSSFSSSTQKTANGYEHTGTRTGPNGQSVTTQGGAAYDPATGTVNQSRTTTGPNGKSAAESRTITVQPKTSAASTGG